MTSLIGPYDKIPRDKITRLQVGVPEELVNQTLLSRFPHRGFRDRALAILFDAFLRQVESEIPQGYSINNEEHAKRILDRLQSNLRQSSDSVGG